MGKDLAAGNTEKEEKFDLFNLYISLKTLCPLWQK
ncbi:MAG: hypothetical protein AVDCRST_MAG74-3384 [uncultured Pyrinomonadaceae bacterium]|uniref:Uncharacterized protein n=1 Tax=uncultured Pyrinomonadaceae bacterium TaxID=2283094 RepID=A0A6J4PX31_9BACT|nr:MAG: hypothetical protein AVDCRST_MAG74-3384 [uncultured Pyrinomonadaceae bacterium]